MKKITKEGVGRTGTIIEGRVCTRGIGEKGEKGEKVARGEM